MLLAVSLPKIAAETTYSNCIVVCRSRGGRAVIALHLLGELAHERLVGAAHRRAERRALQPEPGPHVPRVQLPQRHHLVPEHERVTAEPGDPVHAGASRWLPTRAEQHHRRPHWEAGRGHRGARILE